MANGHRIKLTAAEKVLLHLYEYTKYADHFEVPFAVTQDGIAEAVGILRSHVPRALKGLIDKGYVEEKLAHVIGSERRRKVYFLTTPGIAYAKKIREDVKAVEWIFGLGEEKEERILKEVMKKEEKKEKKTFLEGVCYLIEFVSQNFVFSLLKKEVQGNCLILSRLPPQRIKNILGNEKMRIYWLSQTESENSLSATNLVRIFSVIKSFGEEVKSGFVVIDGIEYLVAQNGLDPILKFIHMVEDFIVANNLTLILPISPGALDRHFLSLLEREFEVIREEGVSELKAQAKVETKGSELIDFLEKVSVETTTFRAKIPAVVHFFGRGEELKKIEEFLNSKTHKFMVIYGIAGMGKTTLGAKAARNYVRNYNVFWMRIYDWVNLRTVISELGEILFLLKRQGLKSYVETKQKIEIGEVLGILERELRNTNLLLFIDDFQKIDEEIRRFFNSLLDVLAGIEGVKIILLTRHIVPFYDIRDVEQRKLVVEMELKGLDRQSAFEFLRLKGFPEHMFEQIYALTKGHPLALEFLRSAEDVKYTSSGIYKFIYNEIFLKLSEEEKALLKSISVFRHPIAIETITYTFPTFSTEIITNLINRGMLSHVGNNHYEMHEIVREFFYNMMTPAERVEAHRRASHYYLDLISSAAPFSERTYLECAYHLYKTKDFEKVVEIISNNAFRLLQQGCIHELLELLENLPEIAFTSRIEVYLLKGTIYDILARWDDALKAYTAALNIANNLLSEKERASKLMRIYERIGHVHYNRSAWVEGIKSYEESLRIARELNDAKGIAYAEQGLALIYWRTGEYEKAKNYINDALSHAEALNEVSLYINLKIERGMIYSEVGDVNSAISAYKDAIKCAEEHCFYYEMARAYHNIAGSYLEINDIENAVKSYEKALELFKKLGYFRETYWTMFNLAEVYIRARGDVVKAEEYLKEAYVNLKRIGDLHGVASVYRYMGVAKRLKGDFIGAEEALKKSIELLEKLNLPHRLAESYFELGMVYKSQLRKDEAIECFEKAYSIFEKIGAKVYYLRKLYETMRQ